MTKPTILNTRPLALQAITQEAFEQQGFAIINFPCIEIALVNDPQNIRAQLAAIKPQDCIIFTSQYAVRYAYKIHPEFTIPKDAVVITVGSKTAQVLEQYYNGHIWIPEQQNSEGVIDLLKGFASQKNIKLISAENGRTAIQTYAIEKANVFQQINVYTRQLPSINPETVELIRKTNPIYILATSETTLVSLKALLNKEWDKLLNQKVLCASTRILDTAKNLGFQYPIDMNTANPVLMAEKLRKLVNEH